MDNFIARYFSAAQGRFGSADDPLAGQNAGDPQSWNLFSFGLNNPLKYTDPDGHEPCAYSACVIGSTGSVVTYPTDVGAWFVSRLSAFSQRAMRIADDTATLANDTLRMFSDIRNNANCTQAFTLAGTTAGALAGGGLVGAAGGAVGFVGGSIVPVAGNAAGAAGGFVIGTFGGAAAGGSAGGALGALGGLVLCNNSTTAGGGGNKGTGGLLRKIEEHKRKLADYLNDPDAYDNKGILKNASPEIRQRIIEGRARHLQGEIDAFEKGLERMLNGK